MLTVASVISPSSSLMIPGGRLRDTLKVCVPSATSFITITTSTVFLVSPGSKTTVVVCAM